jgi:hypothetical protein
MDTNERRRLSLEAEDLLSAPKMSKANRARVKEIVETLSEALSETNLKLRELELAGLNIYHKRKLARLESLHGRLVNAQVCWGCKQHLDSILEELGYM